MIGGGRTIFNGGGGGADMDKYYFDNQIINTTKNDLEH